MTDGHKIKPCPRCGVIDYYRIKRKWWMRLIPHSKNYKCQRCDCEFIKISGRVIFL